jgi:hypothetical protein
LDLLGFIRPNPGFSTGYGGKNKKIPVSLLGLARREFDPARQEWYITCF